MILWLALSIIASWKKQRSLKMKKSVHLEKIEKEIEKLAPKDQLRLVEKLAHQLREHNLSAKKELSWNRLYGLGKGLWEVEDGQEYVNRLREER
jgi:hypothetical protein